MLHFSCCALTQRTKQTHKLALSKKAQKERVQALWGVTGIPKQRVTVAPQKEPLVQILKKIRPKMRRICAMNSGA